MNKEIEGDDENNKKTAKITNMPSFILRRKFPSLTHISGERLARISYLANKHVSTKPDSDPLLVTKIRQEIQTPFGQQHQRTLPLSLSFCDLALSWWFNLTWPFISLLLLGMLQFPASGKDRVQPKINSLDIGYKGDIPRLESHVWDLQDLLALIVGVCCACILPDNNTIADYTEANNLIRYSSFYLLLLLLCFDQVSVKELLYYVEK